MQLILSAMKRIAAICHLVFVVLTSPAQIMIDSTLLDTVTVASGLNTVWDMVYADDGWIWYTERIGRISRVNPQTKQKIVLAELPDVYEDSAGGKEAGLLGMALHPDFTDSPYVFVVYNYLEGSSIKEKLVRFTYFADTLTNQTTILGNINGAGNHNGSRLVFSSDQKIFMTTGDGGIANNAQEPGALEGKILRMNPDGTIPEDNPLNGSLIWSLGSRNAQGLAFGPDGVLYSSEHGPSSDDEINIIKKGRNYGWPAVHGFCDLPSELQFCIDSNVAEPIFTWTPTIAPADILYYAHPAIPEFSNTLLLCTLKEQDLRVIRLNSMGDTVISEMIYFNAVFGRIRAICPAPNGDIFIGTSNRDGRAQNPFPIAADDRIIRLRSSVILGTNPSKQKKSFAVFPNPAPGKFLIEGAGMEPFSVEIYNITGQKKYYSFYPGNEEYGIFEIDVSDYSEGIYCIIITADNYIQSKKLFISGG